MPALDALLTRSEELAQAATPGPWFVCGGGKADVHVNHGDPDKDSCSYTDMVAEYESWERDLLHIAHHHNNNADFIAHARTALPKLVAIVRELHASLVDALACIEGCAAMPVNTSKYTDALARAEALAAGKES